MLGPPLFLFPKPLSPSCQPLPFPSSTLFLIQPLPLQISSLFLWFPGHASSPNPSLMLHPEPCPKVTTSVCQTISPSFQEPHPPSGSHILESEEEELELEEVGPSQVPTLAPVTYWRTMGGNTDPTWHPLPQAVVKDLMKAIQEYRHECPYFQGLLSTNLTGNVVVPFDLKQLFRCLTNKTEYKFWESTWKDLLWNALPGISGDPTTASDGRGNAITLDHLCGEGQWALAPTQASDIPAPTLEIMKNLAEKAFLGLRPSDLVPKYSEVKQGPSEPYTRFIE